MKTKAVLIAVLIVLLLILIIQNSWAVPIRLYFWTISIPAFLMILGIFLVGLLVGYLAAHMEKRRDRKLAALPPPAPPRSASILPPSSK
jgi:uncharacterized integral membrane protein